MHELECFFAEAPMGLALIDKDLRYSRVNERLAAIHGLSVADHLGKRIHEVMPEMARQVESTLHDVFAGGEPAVLDVAMRSRTGREAPAYYQVAFCPLKTDAGDVYAVGAMVHDVTAMKGTQQALFESERQLRTILQNAPEFIINVDREGTILFINRTVAPLEPEQVLGRSIYPFVPEAFHDTVRRNIAAAFETGRPGTYEAMGLGPHGGQAWYSTCVGPNVRDGMVESVTLIAHDITQFKTTLQRLADSEEKYRVIFESESDAIFITDPVSNEILDVNRAASTLYGYTKEEMLGRSCLLLSADADRSHRAIQYAVKHGMHHQYSNIHRKKDGTLFPVEISSGVFTLRGRKMLCAIMRDHTERVRSEELLQQKEEQIRHAQKMESIGKLASGVAHDFNNILAGIMGNASLIQMEMDGDGRVGKHVDEILTITAKAANITGQLLAFARQDDSLLRPCSMHRVIQNAITLLRHTMDRRITLRTNLAADHDIVMGSSTQLEQVVLNIALNAADAMLDGGGTLSIMTACTSRKALVRTGAGGADQMQAGSFLEIIIADTGCGMAPEILDRVMEPFFTTKEVGKGTGLGLASAYGIIQKHLGHILIRSQRGEGTCVLIDLPLDAHAADMARVQQSPMTTAAAGSGRVLLIEDEEAVSRSLSVMLEKLGYHVHIAADGEAGLQYYRAHWEEVTLVLLDINMPRMNGEDCFNRMKRINAGLRCIVISGFLTTALRENLLDRGVRAVLDKPFGLPALSKEIAMAIAAP